MAVCAPSLRCRSRLSDAQLSRCRLAPRRHGYDLVDAGGRRRRVLVSGQATRTDPCGGLVLARGGRVALIWLRISGSAPATVQCHQVMLATGSLRASTLRAHAASSPNVCVDDLGDWLMDAHGAVTGLTWQVAKNEASLQSAWPRYAATLTRVRRQGAPHSAQLAVLSAQSPFANPFLAAYPDTVAPDETGTRLDPLAPVRLGFDAAGTPVAIGRGVLTDMQGNAIVAETNQRAKTFAYTTRSATGAFTAPRVTSLAYLPGAGIGIAIGARGRYAALISRMVSANRYREDLEFGRPGAAPSVVRSSRRATVRNPIPEQNRRGTHQPHARPARNPRDRGAAARTRTTHQAQHQTELPRRLSSRRRSTKDQRWRHPPSRALVLPRRQHPSAIPHRTPVGTVRPELAAGREAALHREP